MPGIIDTVYVRIRPDTSGLRSETLQGVRTTLRGVQAEIQAGAKQQIAATQTEIQANTRLSESYGAVGTSALAASRESVAGSRAAGEASVVASREMVAGAERSAVAAGELKSRFLEIGKVLGIAFGAEILVEFTKEVTKDAAQVQKSMEVIKDSFGKDSAEVVTGFGESTARSFGIAAKDADAFSARLGILFGNIGIAQPTAAKMTINLIKLAGSLAAIKGVSPEAALSNLDRAMLGNVRGLKALGLSVDPALIKLTALKLGLIQQGEAVTPAARAQAIYALATARLPHYLDQAKQHSQDYANVQMRLSAEWSNAKDIIGTALLPAFDKAASGLANWLEKQNQTGALQEKVNAVLKVGGQVFRGFTDAIRSLVSVLRPVVDQVGGFKQAAKDLILVWAGFKIFNIVRGIGELGAALASMPLPVVGVLTLAAGFAVAYEKSATFRRVVGGLKEDLGGIGGVLGGLKEHLSGVVPAFESLYTRVKPSLDSLATSTKEIFHSISAVVMAEVHVIEAVWSRFGDTIKQVTATIFGGAAHVIKDDLDALVKLIALFADVLTGKWGKAWGDLKGIAKDGLDSVTTVVKTWGSALLDIFNGIWQSIELAMLKGVKAALDAVGQIKTKFDTHIPGVGKIGFTNPAIAAGRGIEGKIAAVEAADARRQAERDAAAQAKAAIQASKDAAAGVAAETQAKVGAGAARAAAATAQAAKQTGDKVRDEIIRGTRDASNAANAAVAAAGSKDANTVLQNAAAGISDARAKIAQLKDTLHQTIQQNATDLTAAIEQAKTNLISIGSTLASTIGQAMDAPFARATKAIQDAEDKLTLTFDKRGAVLAAAGQKIQNEQDKIAATFDAKAAKLDAQARHIAALQSRFSLKSDERSLAALRASVRLPGGGLSEDAATAVKQLEALANKHGINRGAFGDFIDQYQQAALAVQSDKLGIKQTTLTNQRATKETPLNLAAGRNRVNQDALDTARTTRETALRLQSETLKVQQNLADSLKTRITRQIADLTTGLNTGQIKVTAFTKRIANLLQHEAPSYGKAGKLLGSAFRLQFEAEAGTIIKQAQAIAAAPRRAGTGQEPKVVQPLLTLEKGNREIARITTQIGNTQTALLRRIAKANEAAAKAAKAAETKAAKAQAKKRAATTAAGSVHLGPTAADVMPGTQSQISKNLSGASN